jgi:hypothetical protein
VSIFAVLGYSLQHAFGNRGDFVISGIIEPDDIHVGSKLGGRVHKSRRHAWSGGHSWRTLVRRSSGGIAALWDEALMLADFVMFFMVLRVRRFKKQLGESALCWEFQIPDFKPGDGSSGCIGRGRQDFGAAWQEQRHQGDADKRQNSQHPKDRRQLGAHQQQADDGRREVFETC